MSEAGQSRRAWGWHPLTDAWAARVVGGAGVRPGELVLDIGAGRGAITRHLVDAGARVVAVELHPGRVEHLRHRFAADPVTVVHADAAALRLLKRLLAPGSRLVAADIVLQRAVVRRFADGHASGAGRWQRHWSAELGPGLPRTAFRPPPRVDSSVLVIRRTH